MRRRLCSLRQQPKQGAAAAAGAHAAEHGKAAADHSRRQSSLAAAVKAVVCSDQPGSLPASSAAAPAAGPFARQEATTLRRNRHASAALPDAPAQKPAARTTFAAPTCQHVALQSQQQCRPRHTFRQHGWTGTAGGQLASELATPAPHVSSSTCSDIQAISPALGHVAELRRSGRRGCCWHRGCRKRRLCWKRSAQQQARCCARIGLLWACLLCCAVL